MNTAPQLPTLLGAFSAMLVAFLGLLNGTSPATCLMKSFAAFLVFAGLGLIVRGALADLHQGEAERKKKATRNAEQDGPTLDVVVPGASVADLLGAADAQDGDKRAA